MEDKYLMSKETTKKLSDKLKFNNKIAEAFDDAALNLLNKLILNKIAEKLPEDILPVVQDALVVVIDEMPEIEI